jgi:hypothetical protein
MPIRLRKLFGGIALILLVTVWALLAMALAQLPVIKAHGLVEVIYYVVAGLGWVLPAMPPGRRTAVIGWAADASRVLPVPIDASWITPSQPGSEPVAACRDRRHV